MWDQYGPLLAVAGLQLLSITQQLLVARAVRRSLRPPPADPALDPALLEELQQLVKAARPLVRIGRARARHGTLDRDDGEDDS